MRLLRITSDKEDGSFETFLNTDLDIKENSSIALKNLSMTTAPVFFSVDAVTSNIKFNFNDAGNPIQTIDVDLKNRNVNETNAHVMFKDMQDKLNDNIPFTPLMMGSQFFTGIQNGKFRFEMASYPYILDENMFRNGYFAAGEDLVTVTSEVATSSVALENSGADVTDDSPIYYSEMPFTKGCGVFRATVTNFVDTGTNNNGLFFGVSTEPPSSWEAPNMSIEDLGFGIKLLRDPGNGGTYIGYADDESGGQDEVDSGVSYSTGDVIEISRRLGRLHFSVYSGIPKTRTDIFDAPDHADQQMYPYVILRNGTGKLKLEGVRAQLDSFKANPLVPNTAAQTVYLNDSNLVVPHPRPDQDKTMTFEANKDLLQFLGYDLSQGSLKAGTLLTIVIPNKDRTDGLATADFLSKANNRFLVNIYNAFYLVVLDNLNLNSYDGLDGVRRNILDTVPATDRNGNQLVEYEPNTLNFIDINNKSKQNLRNLRGRILRADLRPIELDGLLNLTLLIK